MTYDEQVADKEASNNGEDLLENFWNAFNSHASASEPQHNIIKLSENEYRIDIVVAGFTKSELSVTLFGNELTVAGTKNLQESDTEYLHQGFSTNGFKQEFKLVEHIIIKSVRKHDGVLKIKLARKIPEQAQLKTLTIE